MKNKNRSCSSILFKSIIGIAIFLGIVYLAASRYIFMPWEEHGHPQFSHVRGIDISRHQKHINWDKLADAEIDGDKISFVYIKATEGKKYRYGLFFRNNFREARTHGILRGAYHYWRNTEPEAQAEAFIKRVKLRKGDLAPMLDVEEIPNENNIEKFQKDVLKWLDIIERHYGIRPIIYAYRDFVWKYLDSEEFEKYPLWIAHHYVKRPVYFDDWEIWQYSDRGRISGIDNNVDINVFNGTRKELEQLTIK